MLGSISNGTVGAKSHYLTGFRHKRNSSTKIFNIQPTKIIKLLYYQRADYTHVSYDVIICLHRSGISLIRFRNFSWK